MTLRFRWLAGVVMGGVMATGATTSVAQMKQTKELIFEGGATSFPSSHASTVVELKGGELMSAWFKGTAEGKANVAIWGSRKTAKGWSAPEELARENGVRCWNPVLFHTKDGVL